MILFELISIVLSLECLFVCRIHFGYTNIFRSKISAVFVLFSMHASFVNEGCFCWLWLTMCTIAYSPAQWHLVFNSCHHIHYFFSLYFLLLLLFIFAVMGKITEKKMTRNDTYCYSHSQYPWINLLHGRIYRVCCWSIFISQQTRYQWQAIVRVCHIFTKPSYHKWIMNSSKE